MDLVTRLLLNTTQFNNNIASSTQQVQQFQRIGESVTSAIGKFAGVLGLGMGAMEAFNRTMEATQSTGDAFERITTQGTAAVDTFFNALSRGDFSSFLSGLQNAIDKAGILADALDQLQSKSLFNDMEINNLSTKKQIYQNKAKDKTLSDEERNKYNNLAKQTQNKINIRKQDVASANNEAYYAGVRALLAKGGYTGKVSNEMIDYLMKETSRSERAKQAEKYDNTIKYYQREKNKHTTVTEGRNGTQTVKYDAEYYKMQAQENEYKKKSYAKLNKVIEDTNEDEIRKIYQYKQTADQQLLDISDSQLELNNTSAKINGSYKAQHKQSSGKSGKGSTTKEVFNPGSLDDINKQLADARKKYNAAATDELRAELHKVVSDLEAQTIHLNFVAEYGEMKDTKPKMAGVLGDNTKGTDFSKISTKSLTDKITKKDIKINNEFAESLYVISNVMGNLSGTMSDSAQEWTNFASTVLGAVASAIPAIQSLAMAEGIEQSQKMPFPANLIALTASVTAIIGAFAQVGKVKKMAEGGLVYGNSLVNVGEYAGASSNPEVIAPLNKLKQIIKPQSNDFSGGNVTFEIEGRKLVGVLSNYNKQQNRIK